jgi:hypothetical protein
MIVTTMMADKRFILVWFTEVANVLAVRNIKISLLYRYCILVLPIYPMACREIMDF